MKILIVEDNQLPSDILSRFLSINLDAPFQIERRCRLSDALHSLRHESFDVVLLDLLLPDSRGLQTVVRMAAAYPMLPVVVLTDLDDEQSAIQSLRFGAQDYLIKGEMHCGMLLRSLRYAVERRRCLTAEQKIAEAQQRERKRLSRELHDGVIQSLSSLRLQLQMLASKTESLDPATADSIRQMADTTLDAIDDVRRVSRDLHPAILDRRSLGDALILFGKRLQAETGMVIKVFDRCRGEISHRAKQHLYRVAQEALRNAIRHSHAACVVVKLDCRSGKLTLEVRDNGSGFDNAADATAHCGLGLTSIRERAKLLDGMVLIQSRRNEGTVIRVEVPAGCDFQLNGHAGETDTEATARTPTPNEALLPELQDADPHHVG